MRLTSESLLAYEGLHGMNGLAHVRPSEEPGQIPVVTAGEFDDNGTHLTVGIETVRRQSTSACSPMVVSFGWSPTHRDHPR
jgi:hypothetical protein